MLPDLSTYEKNNPLIYKGSKTAHSSPFNSPSNQLIKKINIFKERNQSGRIMKKNNFYYHPNLVSEKANNKKKLSIFKANKNQSEFGSRIQAHKNQTVDHSHNSKNGQQNQTQYSGTSKKCFNFQEE